MTNTNKAPIKISDQNDFRNELISITAHSLRTSLSATKWVLQMFIDKDFGDLSPEQFDMLKKTYENNERMISVVNDMIKVNKTLEFNNDVKKSDFDLVKLIDDLVFDFSAESFKYKIQIIFLKPDFKCEINSWPEKARLVFSNLIENAIKYSSANDKIFISINKDENGYTVSIKDTGIGIPKAEQDHVFEKFYRATNAILKEPTGSGIGLYTVKNIMDSLGGKISFRSDELGTTFNVVFK